MGVRELDFEEGMASIQLNGKRAAVYDVEARLRLMRYDVVPSCYDGYKEVRLVFKLYYIL